MVHPPKNDNTKRLLQPQLKRVILIKKILLDFFIKEYEFPAIYQTRLNEQHVARLDFLHHVLTSPTERLIIEFDNIDLAEDEKIEKLNEELQEAKRLITKPYLTSKQIVSIVEFRHEIEKDNDEETKDFLKRHQAKKGFFSSLF